MKRFKENDIHAMVEILEKDGTLSVPTDTVYGVCCRYDHEAAQEKLRDVKKRPATKAFPIMCADEEQIKTICDVDERSEKLIRAFMPGPVTLILPKKNSVPFYVNGGMPTLAIRMATSEPLKELIQSLGSPVFMTSANQSGEEVCTNLDEIEKHELARELLSPHLNAMFVTPKDIDEAVKRLSYTISEGLNLAFSRF